jgi:hypothetical protein
VLRFPLLDPANDLLIEIVQGRIKDYVLAFPAEYYAELRIDTCI